MNRLKSLRAWRMTGIMAGVAILVLIGRTLWINGVFSTAKSGFFGTCKVIAQLPGVEDIEIANGVAFVSAASARGPGAADGIYALPLTGSKLTKLSGAPKDFHPRGIGLYRSPDGSGIFLMAVNRRSTGRFSIDSFEVTNPLTTPALVALGTVEGGLLINPQDVAAAGPGSFYVANGTASKNGFVHTLQTYGVIAGGNILYFNGMSFRVAADGLYGVRSVLLTPDGTHLVASSLLTRSLKTFNREPLNGALSDGDGFTMPAAPEKLTLDNRGEIWAAGHANLLPWRAMVTDPAARSSSQIFRVGLASGVPQDAEQIYGNDGGQIAGASVAASLGKRLLIGSSLDGRLLDCAAK
jgi:arylesterase/paraoxonase